MSNVIKALSGLGLLIGVIVGAGMFAMPHAVAKAGLVWGSIHIVLAFGLLTLVHLLYGEVIFSTPGQHRLPGYARIHIGPWGGTLSLLSALVGFYGALLAYGILGGSFLQEMIGSADTSPALFSFLFFMVAGSLLYFNIMRVGALNFLLTAVLVLFVIVLAWFALPHVTIERIPFVDTTFWFLPYGVFLFAFGGASAIPDVADIFRRKNEGLFRKVVVLSTVIPLILYIIFIVSVVGITGIETSPEGIFGLRNILGERGIFVGSLIGFLAVFTSFLSMGLDLKNVFAFDYNIRHVLAWLFVLVVPPLLFLLGATNFIAAIALVGAVAIGIDGILILLSALRVCRSNGGCRVGSFSIGTVLPWMLIVALTAGVIYELFLNT